MSLTKTDEIMCSKKLILLAVPAVFLFDQMAFAAKNPTEDCTQQFSSAPMPDAQLKSAKGAENTARQSRTSTNSQKNSVERQDRENAITVIPKFKAFFAALNQRMFERDYMLELAAVTLIAKEHLLLMGPPGNAKSQIADLVLGSILDDGGDPSYFRLQMTPETTMSETHGPFDFVKLTRDGVQARMYDQGALKSKHVFLDEIFDARANATRNILALLAERIHAQGPNIIKADLQTAIAATNRYLSEVYEKAGDDGPRAVVDRFAILSYVAATFESADASVALITRRARDIKPIPKLTFSELGLLQSLTNQVEIPTAVAKALTLLSYRMKEETEALELTSLKDYKRKIRDGEDPGVPYRATKHHSPRTLGKAANFLRALVVRDWTTTGGKRKLVANVQDIAHLEKFFTLMLIRLSPDDVRLS